MGILDYGSIKRTKFVNFLGTGFRSSNFYVEITFPKTSIFTGSSHVYQKMLQVKEFTFGTLPYYLMYKNPSNPLVIDGLITKMQIPGYDVSTASDVFPYLQRIKSGTFSQTITLDFINDQWNVQWIFWRKYISYNTLYQVQYPIDCEFDITVYFQDAIKIDYYKITFKNCLLTKIPDLDMAYVNTSLTSIKLDFTFVSMITEKINTSIQNIVSSEVNFIADSFVLRDKYIEARDKAIKSMKKNISSNDGSSTKKQVIDILDAVINGKLNPDAIAKEITSNSYLTRNPEILKATENKTKNDINGDLIYNISEKNHKDKDGGKFKAKENESTASTIYNEKSIFSKANVEAQTIVKNYLFEQNLDGKIVGIKDIQDADQLNFLKKINKT